MYTTLKEFYYSNGIILYPLFWNFLFSSKFYLYLARLVTCQVKKW